MRLYQVCRCLFAIFTLVLDPLATYLQSDSPYIQEHPYLMWRARCFMRVFKPCASTRSSFPMPGGCNRLGLNCRFYSSTKSESSGSKGQLWLLIIPVTTFCLGTWQIYRLQWKLDLIERLERKTKRSPVPIPTDIGERLEEYEYRRVRLHGYFDHSKELYMWPRTLNTGEATPTNNRGSEPGAYVVTPFFCEELGRFVLVNRGWVPRRRMDPSSRAQGQVEGPITLTAVVRTGETRASFSPKNDPLNNRWAYRDVTEMANSADTAPIFLEADSTTTVRGGPIGGQTRVTLRNEHLQYVFTWYSLSLLTGYMFYQLWRKAKRRK